MTYRTIQNRRRHIRRIVVFNQLVFSATVLVCCVAVAIFAGQIAIYIIQGS